MPQSWHPVTVRQLLYHTSGIPSYTATPAFQTYFPTTSRTTSRPQQIIGFAATEPSSSLRDEYEYSNTGTIVLGLMSETVTGRSYAQNLGDLVLKPLGMRETTLPFTPPPCPSPSSGATCSAGPDSPRRTSRRHQPVRGLGGGRDRLDPPRPQRLRPGLGRRQLVDKPAIRRAQTGFLPPFSGGEPIGPGQNRGGLTLYRYKTPCGTVFGHSGNFPGYTQWMASSFDGTRSAIVTMNLQVNIPDPVLPQVASSLRRVFRRAACAALAGS